MTTAENYKVFKEVYADRITKQRDQLIRQELNDYREILKKLGQNQGLIYYAKSGAFEFSNSPNQAKDYFKSFPSYMVFDAAEQQVFPGEITKNTDYSRVKSSIDQIGQKDVIYIAFTEEYLNPRITEWQENKILGIHSLYQIAGFSLLLAAAFIYLLLVIGRKPEDDETIYLNSINRIYNDLNIGMCFALIVMWIGIMSGLVRSKSYMLIIPVTLLIASLGLILVLSLVKHLKKQDADKAYLNLYRLL